MKKTPIAKSRIFYKTSRLTSSLRNERGFVLIAALMFLLVLAFLGTYATNTTTVELQIAGNDRFARLDFYNQEASLKNGQISNTNWLPVLLAGGDDAFFPPPPATASDDTNGNGIDDRSEYTDFNGQVVGSYKVRKITDPGVPVTGWEDAGDYADLADHPANRNLPQLEHKGKPPVGSGFGQNLVIARYAITSYSSQDDRRTVVQAGVYKVFQQSNQ